VPARDIQIWGSVHRSLVVDVAAVADLDDPDDQPVVLQLTDNAIVPDAVAPESLQVAAEGLFSEPRIGKLNDFLKVCDDSLLPRPVDLSEVLERCSIEFNLPALGFA